MRSITRADPNWRWYQSSLVCSEKLLPRIVEEVMFGWPLSQKKKKKKSPKKEPLAFPGNKYFYPILPIEFNWIWFAVSAHLSAWQLRRRNQTRFEQQLPKELSACETEWWSHQFFSIFCVISRSFEYFWKFPKILRKMTFLTVVLKLCFKHN